MSRGRQIASRVLLAVWAANSVAALARLQHTSAAWWLVPVCTAAVFLQLSPLPARLRAAARYAAWAALAGTLVLGIIFMAYPVLEATTARRLTLFAGYSAAGFALLFLAGARTFTVAHDLLPAGVGTLVVACFSTARGAPVFAAASGLLLVAWLVLEHPPAVPHALRIAVSLRAVVFFVAFAATAAAIIRVLPPAQDQVEKTIAQLATPQEAIYRGFTTDSTLGDLEELKLSPKLVMRVWTGRPQKLRAGVFVAFDGRRWRAGGGMGRKLAPVTSTALQTVPGNAFDACTAGGCVPSSGRPLATRIVQKSFGGGLLVSPGGTRLLRVPAPMISVKPFRIFDTAAETAVAMYGTVNGREQDVVEIASRDAVPALCLQPGTTEPRIRELAARLAAGAATDADKLRRTIDFLQTEYHYSLKPGKFHSSQPLAEFLFEKKVGYCEYFASAAAVLLRMQGVPARYVTGFNVGPANRKGDHYVVRQKDAHAWIEAYLDGRGWVEAEPTPSSEYEAATADVSGGRLDELLEEAQARFAEAWARLRIAGWRGAAKLLLWILAFAAVAFMSLAAARWLRRRPGRRRAPQPSPFPSEVEVAELLRLLDALWKQLGFPRPASRAPLEHALSLPSGKVSPEFFQAIECVYRACFAGKIVSPEEFAQASAALRPLR